MEFIFPYVWIGIMVAAAVVEGLTTQLVSVWFVVGGLAAFISTMCSAPTWLQVLIFAAVTGVALLVTRPFVRRVNQARKISTNADRYIGQEGEVIVSIEHQSDGQVKVMGSVWTARSEDGEALPEHTPVLVERIEGVKLIVKAIEPEPDTP